MVLGSQTLQQKEPLPCGLSKIHKICCLSATYFVQFHNTANINKQMADLCINIRTKPKITNTELANS